MDIEKFKTQCIEVIDQVQNSGKPIIITKKGVPLAKLSPINQNKKILFGRMEGTVHVLKDIIEPINENWDINSK